MLWAPRTSSQARYSPCSSLRKLQVPELLRPANSTSVTSPKPTPNTDPARNPQESRVDFRDRCYHNASRLTSNPSVHPTMGDESFPTLFYFPLPIGGTPDHNDFIPSLLFIACYLVPFVLAIRKAFMPSTRTVVTINSTLVPMERMIILSFRAIMSRDDTLGKSSRKNWSIIEYTQASTGVSTFALLDEISCLLHSLCILATRENVPYDEWKDQGIGGDQGRARAEERKKIRASSTWFSGTLGFVTCIQWTVPTLCETAATTQGTVKWFTALR